MEQFACRVAAWFGHPAAILAQLVVTGLSLLTLGVDSTTLLLSIEAITVTQLALVAQGRTEQTTKHALAELVRAVPNADDSVAQEVDPE